MYTTEWLTEKYNNRCRQMWKCVITDRYCCGFAVGWGLAGFLPPCGHEGGNPPCINGFLIAENSVFKCARSFFPVVIM
jgi:hypothetical protein